MDDTCPTTFKEKFPYPSCWNNEDRMRVLFSPFKSRDLNPENYDSKLLFWENLVNAYCQFLGTPIFNITTLKKTFIRNEKVPECLPTVIDHLLGQKQITLLNYYQYDPLNSWRGWAMISFVKRPLSWGWNRVRSAVFAGSYLEQIDYVHLGAIKEFINILVNEVLPNKSGEIMHFDKFAEAVHEEIYLTNECLQLCLVTLHLQGKIGLSYTTDKNPKKIHLVKIPSTINSNIEISDFDNAVHNLQKTQQSLNKQLEEMESQISALADKARSYLMENKRSLAKNCLRKKHLIEKRFDKHSVALNNIETLLQNVYDSQSNGEILDAYKIGSKALQSALKDSGLTFDNVDEVICEVRDAIEAHKEIDDTISNSNIIDGSICEAEDLEAELQQLTKEGNTIYDNNNLETNTDLVTIDDEELLGMLDNLQVVNETLSCSSSVDIKKSVSKPASQISD